MLVIAKGSDWEEVTLSAESGVALAPNKFWRMGLSISPEKTEAIWFCRLSWWKRPQARVRVGSVVFDFRDRMEYLSLLLDGHWRIGKHLHALEPRLQGMTVALFSLLPILNGPDGTVRRLLTGVVLSVALYLAPIWANDLVAGPRSRTFLRSVAHRMANVIVRGCRTISHEAAMVQAGDPPLQPPAAREARIYGILHLGGDGAPEDGAASLRRTVRLSVKTAWRARLRNESSRRHRLVGIVLPVLDAWARSGSRHTFRLTHVLTW
ncbi:PREDICTED: uncharacterized protein LOC108552282 [Eufriesea mexicana]|uniref:uncharacterized protein LOC108552282 n=1 Tax=Eufriesea mexicana TaxID=516756 RepID=UPI00083BD1FA|nr:PREDICTED: uncharacterized protein LOC108552282 [Eufriesea mexicana]